MAFLMGPTVRHTQGWALRSALQNGLWFSAHTALLCTSGSWHGLLPGLGLPSCLVC